MRTQAPSWPAPPPWLSVGTSHTPTGPVIRQSPLLPLGITVTVNNTSLVFLVSLAYVMITYSITNLPFNYYTYIFSLNCRCCPGSSSLSLPAHKEKVSFIYFFKSIVLFSSDLIHPVQIHGTIFSSIE